MANFGTETGDSSSGSNVRGARIVAEAGGQPIYELPNDPNGIRIAGNMLHAGEQIDIAGVPVSVSDGYVVVGSGVKNLTISLGETGTGPNVGFGSGGELPGGDAGPLTGLFATILMAASKKYAAAQDLDSYRTVVLGSLTLSLGGPQATIDGHVVSLGRSGIAIDGSSTMTLDLPIPTGSNWDPKVSDIISLGAQSITASHDSNGDIVVGTRTFSAGGSAITVDGHVLRKVLDGIFVDDSRMLLSKLVSGASGEEEAIISLPDGKVITAIQEPDNQGTAILDGSSITLSIGGPDATIDGEVFSLAIGGVIVNRSVTDMFSSEQTAISTDTSVAGATGPAPSPGNAQATTTSSGNLAPETAGFVICMIISIYFLTFLIQI